MDSTLYPIYYLLLDDSLSPQLNQINIIDGQFTEEKIFLHPGQNKTIAALTNGIIFIYGGNDSSIIRLNTSSAADPTPRIPTGDKPSARLHHAMVGYGDGFFMHGGLDYRTSELLSDLWLFSWKNNWTLISKNFYPGKQHHIQLSYLGSNPYLYFTGLDDCKIRIYDVHAGIIIIPNIPIDEEPCAGSLSVMIINRLFIYGGQTSNGHQSNQLWQLIDQRYCSGLTDCSPCAHTYGCGWCSNPHGAATCISGSDMPYINTTCGVDNYISQMGDCPLDMAKQALIAWVQLGAILIIGIFVLLIIKFRNTKTKGYYAVM
jgi:hypothetical protein